MPEIQFNYDVSEATDLVSKRYPYYGFIYGDNAKPDSCALYSPGNFVCTRKKDHPGPHVGHFPNGKAVSIWWRSRLKKADQAIVVMLRLLK